MQKRWIFLTIMIISLLLVACQADAFAATAVTDNEVVAIQTDPTATPVAAESESPFPPAEIVNDEGGPVSISGEVTYTNPLFTMGVAEPVVILEDQAGFVDRNEHFVMPVESQTLAQITSDFFTSPFTYNIALPIEPQGSLRDVDNDGEEDSGIQTFAIAYWTNTFGDPFLEERDLFGGGWSTAYVSTELSDDASTEREVIGGKFLVYAPDDQQGYPSGFGEDGLLFTEDDPLVTLPQGYTIVDMDSDPFTFDRSQRPVVDLIEPESSALVDYSELSYTEAFDSLVDLLQKEYAFTEYKEIDWEALREEFRPRFEEADVEEDSLLYRRALRDFSWSIPDGHISSGTLIAQDFQEATGGGLGIAIRETDDGRTIVNFLTPGSPAEEAGIQLGAEIITINDLPIDEVVSEAVAFSAPFSTEHRKRLQQLRYATRFPLDTEVTVVYHNPGDLGLKTVTLTAVPEPDSFAFASFNEGSTGTELPLEYEILPDGFGYVQIFSFSDNELLTIQLWERLMRVLNDNGVPGLIIDMRRNGGGSGFLADQMAAYFYDEELTLGNTGRYDEEIDDFYFDSRGEENFIPPAEDLRYDGAVAVLVGPNCQSACEFFSYDMTLQDRAAIVGQYPTSGLGGGIARMLMPEDVQFQYTVSRAVDADGNIHIEGIGVEPTVQVPVTKETLFSEGDPILETAVAHLSELISVDVVEGGALEVGDTITDNLEAGTRVAYIVQLTAGDIVNLYVESEDFDPAVWFFDEAGNLLTAVDDIGEGSTTAGFEDLEIPRDLVLFIQAAEVNDSDGGEYTISIVTANE